MLNLIVATQAEADPVISALKLKKITGSIKYYHKDAIHLVISGMGKCNAATACGWLAGNTMHTDSGNKASVAWLNFGIAGHETADRGTAMIAHKITDIATEQVWFPHRLTNELASSDLITVDKPLDSYRPGQLHDMEASAYTQAARNFSVAELVQSIKVVSDNQAQPLTGVTAKLATKLIEDAIDPVLNCTKTLLSLSRTIPTSDNTIGDMIPDHWHFSVSQTVQLERVLQRHKVLLGPLTAIPDSILKAKSSKEFLAWLQHRVDSADLSL